MTQEIVKTNLDELLADCGTIDAVSWQAPQNMTREKWLEIGRKFGELSRMPKPRNVNIKPAPIDSEYTLSHVLHTDKVAAKPCVYIVKQDERILYVGCSTYGPTQRLKQHLSSRSPLGQYIKSRKPTSDAWKVEVNFYPNRKTALAAELEFIRNLKPEINQR